MAKFNETIVNEVGLAWRKACRRGPVVASGMLVAVVAALVGVFVSASAGQSGGSDPYEAEVLASSPVAYWRFDEPTGDFVDEISSLTFAEGAGVTRGIDSLVASANGQSIEVGATFGATALTSGTVGQGLGTVLPNDVSVEFWTLNQASNEVAGIGAPGGSTGWQVGEFNGDDGVPDFWVDRGTGGFDLVNIEGIGSGSDAQHVVLTKDDDFVTAYVNGQVTGTNSVLGASTFYAPSDDHIVVTGAFVAIGLDELAIYDRALTPGEVQAHFDAGISAPSVPLTFTFTSLLGCEDEFIPNVQDPGPSCAGGGPDGGFAVGDYYFEISVNGGPTTRLDALDDSDRLLPDRSVTGDDGDPLLGDFVGSYDSNGNPIVEFLTFEADIPAAGISTVEVSLFDEDDNADDPIDVSPTDDDLVAEILIDGATGSWSLDGVADSDNIHYLRGNGDTDFVSNGGHPALVTFDVSVREPLAVKDAAAGDIDGDGLLDGWELHGLEVIDVNATHPVTEAASTVGVYTVIDPTWTVVQADVATPDIFVENDWMARQVPNPSGTTLQVAPPLYKIRNSDSYTEVAEAFQLAGDASGNARPMNVWIDTGSLIGSTVVDFEGDTLNPTSPDSGYDLGGGNQVELGVGDMAGIMNICTIGTGDANYSNDGFYIAKKFNFDANRRWVFRYAMTGSVNIMGGTVNNAAGDPTCNRGGQAELRGNDILNVRGDAVVMMHELGHNLGLRHWGGGTSSVNCKPNYVSVMNYSYDRANGILLIGGQLLLDFSPARLPTAGTRTALAPSLDEQAGDGPGGPGTIGGLDETQLVQAGNDEHIVVYNNGGLSPASHQASLAPDYNGDGDSTDVNVTANISANPFVTSCSTDTDFGVLDDFDDWAAVTVGFRQFGAAADGAINPSDDEGLVETDREIAAVIAAGGRADVAVTADGATILAGPGPVTVDLTYSVLDVRFVNLPMVDVALSSGVGFGSLPASCSLTPAGASCTIAPALVAPAGGVPDPVTISLPLVVSATSGDVTVTAVATSQDNPVDNDPDPSNNTVTHVIAIETAGSPPVAVDDTFDILPTGVATLDVLANDSDPDGDLDPTSLQVVTGPALGTANPTGAVIEFTPAAGAAGSDQFTYQVCDLESSCAEATVDLVVLSPPDALDDEDIVATEDSVVIDVLENDTDPDDDLDEASLQLSTFPVLGSATVTVGVDGPEVTYVAGEVSGIDTFTYQVCDDAGLCDTATVTVTLIAPSDCTISGTDDDDVLIGTPGDDVICGFGGADTIDGGVGDDVILAGPGPDTVVGGAGDDVIVGGRGGDDLFGGDGNDTIRGSRGADIIDGGDGNDELRGGKGDDLVEGGDGDDVLYAGKGNDVLKGHGGDDVLRARRGDDSLRGGAGADRLFGGRGEDHLHGGGGADVLFGRRGSDLLEGGSGADEIHGGRGADTALGNGGPDLLFGGRGGDVLDGGAGSDSADGGQGVDTCWAESTSRCEN